MRLDKGSLSFARVLSAAALAALLLVLIGALVPQATKVIYETKSEYNHIIVREDDEGRRYLLFSETGGYQTVRKPGETDELDLPYSRVMIAGLACVENPERMLLVGLGGGSIPTFLHKRYPKTKIDCVEIDADVIDVARRFFGFREDQNLQAHAADGRKFIEETSERYDVIFLDAYGDDFIPKHLTTREFLKAVRRILKPKGIVLGNVWGRYSNPLYDSMVVTYREVFDELYLLKVPDRSNVILVAFPWKEKLTRDDLAKKAVALAKEKDFRYDIEPLVKNGFLDSATLIFDGKVLEDRTIREEQKAAVD